MCCVVIQHGFFSHIFARFPDALDCSPSITTQTRDSLDPRDSQEPLGASFSGRGEFSLNWQRHL